MTSSAMITYTFGNTQFIYRIAGIARRGEEVLIHRSPHKTYWSMPGGRAEWGEDARQTPPHTGRGTVLSDVRATKTWSSAGCAWVTWNDSACIPRFSVAV